MSKLENDYDEISRALKTNKRTREAFLKYPVDPTTEKQVGECQMFKSQGDKDRLIETMNDLITTQTNALTEITARLNPV